MNPPIATQPKPSSNTEKWHSINYEHSNRITPAILRFVFPKWLVSPGSFARTFTGHVASVEIPVTWLKRYTNPRPQDLTKQSFPDCLLRQSDNCSVDGSTQAEPKDDDSGGGREGDETRLVTDGGGSDAPERTEGEAWLTAAQIIVPCEEGNDLCLDDDFSSSWHEEMRSIRDKEAVRNHLTEEFDLPATEIEFEDRGESYVARNGSQKIGHWRSRAAMVADIAASREIPKWVNMWEDLSTGLRGDILTTLRIFVDNCPLCEEAVTIEEKTVDSRDGMIEIFAGTCEGCESRLFEIPSPESA